MYHDVVRVEDDRWQEIFVRMTGLKISLSLTYDHVGFQSGPVDVMNFIYHFGLL